MSIVSRVTRLMKARIEEMREVEEDPLALMDEAIGKLEEDLVRFRQEVTSARASCRLFEHRVEEAEDLRARAADEAAAAVAASNDLVAREALRHKLTAQRQADVYREQLAQGEAFAEQLRGELSLFESRLEEARLNRDTLVVRLRTAELRARACEQAARLDGLGDVPSEGKASDLFSHVIACEENLQRMSAASAGLRELLAEDPKTLFDRLRTDCAIDDELAELKESPQGGQKRPRRKASEKGA